MCGTIPPVFWYNYPNCAPQAPQGKRSLRAFVEAIGEEVFDLELSHAGWFSVFRDSNSV